MKAKNDTKWNEGATADFLSTPPAPMHVHSTAVPNKVVYASHGVWRLFSLHSGDPTATSHLLLHGVMKISIDI